MKKINFLSVSGFCCLVGGILLLIHCGNSTLPMENETKELKKDSAKVVEKKNIYDRKFNDLAHFIAGMSSDTGGKEYADLEKKSAWINYKRVFDSSWNVLETKRLMQMRQWAATDLADANKTSQNIFYPFSGPDFLNVITLFPKGKEYIMMGLEPVGDIADIKSLKENDLKDYLFSIYNSLSDIFKKSYFITRKMGKDMHSNEINGVTPILYVFLARTGNQVMNVKKISVNESGAIEDYNPDAKVKSKAKGVQIEFLPSGTDSIRTLYYFSVNVEDAKLKDNPGFVKYLDNIGIVTSYVKSASYLMHYLTFSVIRNAVLNHSTYLLQDDSGIAYRFFDKKEWDFRYYGVYTAPVEDFKKQYEKDLAQAYKNDSLVKPIPFKLGYHWGTRGVNLLFASKKQSPKK